MQLHPRLAAGNASRKLKESDWIAAIKIASAATANEEFSVLDWNTACEPKASKCCDFPRAQEALLLVCSICCPICRKSTRWPIR